MKSGRWLLQMPLPASISASTQTACNNITNFYGQDLIINYIDQPTTGTLLVNAQNFPITGSPQTITLINLVSDANPVDVTAQFSDDLTCARTSIAVFTAPVACDFCDIQDIVANTQTSCDPSTQTYTQELIITYINEPATGNLDVNGQSFAITGSPQTVILTGLSSDGTTINVTASFSDENTCTFTKNNAFTAQSSCFCGISDLVAAIQTTCDTTDNSYTQQVIVTYTNPPNTGTLDINGQSFPITASPQTVVLTGLVSDGNPFDVNTSFSALPVCSNSDCDCIRTIHHGSSFRYPVSEENPRDPLDIASIKGSFPGSGFQSLALLGCCAFHKEK